MKAFQQVLKECALSSLGYSGVKFTWQNCREGGDFIRERLDRGVANLAWRDFFPNAKITVLMATFSDHALILFSLIRLRVATHRRP